MRTRLCVLVLLLTALSTTFAAADEIRFIYNGPLSDSGIATGRGSFSFPHGLTTVSLADVTGFFFVQTFVFDISEVSETFVYNTNDLIGFSATLTGSALTSTLSLDTVATASSLPGLAPESFHVISLALPYGAYTAVGTGEVVTQGPVTLVPEPDTLVLIGTGLIGILPFVRKRLRI
jgi:hypothetical protein